MNEGPQVTCRDNSRKDGDDENSDGSETMKIKLMILESRMTKIIEMTIIW
jgi:hypothetical protein